MTENKSVKEDLVIFIIFFFIFCFFAENSFAQEKNDEKIEGDVCYVYVVDLKKAEKYKKLYEKARTDENDRALQALEKEAEIQFPKFTTTIGEEELTTKHYQLSNSKKIITASIFYTDESMASHYKDGSSTVESVLLGLMVSDKKRENALVRQNNVKTEVTYDDSTNMVRLEKFVRVNGLSYIVGLECDFAAKGRNTK